MNVTDRGDNPYWRRKRAKWMTDGELNNNNGRKKKKGKKGAIWGYGGGRGGGALAKRMTSGAGWEMLFRRWPMFFSV